MNAQLINTMIALAVQAITAARQVRDAAVEANPGEALPDDATIIQKLITDAKLGSAETAQFREWLKTLS